MTPEEDLAPLWEIPRDGTMIFVITEEGWQDILKIAEADEADVTKQ